MKVGLDFSAEKWPRVIVLTILGTACCIAVAFAVDSYSFQNGWQLGPRPLNNLIIPLLLAPPFFFYLLSKLRQLAIANARLLQVASTDNLTNCLSRAAFTTLVDAYLERVAGKEGHAEGALIVLDVDNFKSVNDRYGHDNGDVALQLIVQKIQSQVRDIDLVGRMGGEEFAVFLPGLPRGSTIAVAERIRSCVCEIPFRPQSVSCPLSVSVGVVTFAGPALFHDLYRQADQHLYEAKRTGKNRVKAGHHRTAIAAIAN
ncbi:MAG: GGDEF domain-containing protein [Rhizobiaceae bacterium]|nr:GGDEF domain-containing protein [Rhizobiaceae bacterium]